MEIQSNSIILAPSSLHLAIYQQILKQKKNCMNIQVSSLSTFIKSFMMEECEDTLSTIYLYRKRLQSLSNLNSYKGSINDIQFLSSCHDFICWMKLYSLNVTDLKNSTYKEKDIKEVLSLIFDVPVFEDNTAHIIQNMPDMSHVYILNKEMNKSENFWIPILISKGAHLLKSNFTCEIQYNSVANNKKQAEFVAQTIINDDLNADDIFVACNDEAEKQVLVQMLDLYKIPYTLLSQKNISSISREWICCLKWVQKRDLTNFLSLVETLYKEDFEDIYTYFSLFPERFETPGFHLNSIEYSNNNLIQENEFIALQSLENNVQQWFSDHQSLFNWSYVDFELIGNEIQSLHTHVELEDLSVFKKINQFCIYATPYIENADDLSILIQTIEESSLSTKPNEIKGVLIGSKKDISSVRPVLFLIGAHSKNYPALQIEKGLFDEMYLKNTKLPSLEQRLENQKEQMRTSLLDHRKLYVVYPQSNYEGKNYVESNELKDWIQKKESNFIKILEHSKQVKEDFSLSVDTTNSLFFTQNVLSVSRMETYSKCPLQHFLKYGLHLEEPREVSDVQTRGTILHSILEKSTKTYKKDYTKLSRQQIQQLVGDEFSFYLKVYPSKSEWIETQIQEYTNTVELVFSQLNYFENNWHMSFKESEHKFEKETEWNGKKILLKGFVDRIDESNTSFCIFDYKSGKKELEKKKFQNGLSLQLLTYTLTYQEEVNKSPVGCFYITFKAPYSDNPAIKVKYTKKADNATITNLESDDDFIQQNIITGWSFGNFEQYVDETTQIKEKKDKLTIQEVKEQWPIIIQGILDDMSNGNVMPYHTADACKYCNFERICRKTREEIVKESYIEEAD